MWVRCGPHGGHARIYIHLLWYPKWRCIGAPPNFNSLNCYNANLNCYISLKFVCTYIIGLQNSHSDLSPPTLKSNVGVGLQISTFKSQYLHCGLSDFAQICNVGVFCVHAGCARNEIQLVWNPRRGSAPNFKSLNCCNSVVGCLILVIFGACDTQFIETFKVKCSRSRLWHENFVWLLNYCSLFRNWGRWIEWRRQNFDQKLLNTSLCVHVNYKIGQ